MALHKQSTPHLQLLNQLYLTLEFSPNQLSIKTNKRKQKDRNGMTDCLCEEVNSASCWSLQHTVCVMQKKKKNLNHDVLHPFQKYVIRELHKMNLKCLEKSTLAWHHSLYYFRIMPIKSRRTALGNFISVYLQNHLIKLEVEIHNQYSMWKEYLCKNKRGHSSYLVAEVIM